MEMAQQLPETATGMLQITGIGEKKNQKYGAIFLEKIALHLTGEKQ